MDITSTKIYHTQNGDLIMIPMGKCSSSMTNETLGTYVIDNTINISDYTTDYRISNGDVCVSNTNVMYRCKVASTKRSYKGIANYTHALLSNGALVVSKSSQSDSIDVSEINGKILGTYKFKPNDVLNYGRVDNNGIIYLKDEASNQAYAFNPLTYSFDLINDYDSRLVTNRYLTDGNTISIYDPSDTYIAIGNSFCNNIVTNADKMSQTNITIGNNKITFEGDIINSGQHFDSPTMRSPVIRVKRSENNHLVYENADKESISGVGIKVRIVFNYEDDEGKIYDTNGSYFESKTEAVVYGIDKLEVNLDGSTYYATSICLINLKENEYVSAVYFNCNQYIYSFMTRKTDSTNELELVSYKTNNTTYFGKKFYLKIGDKYLDTREYQSDHSQDNGFLNLWSKVNPNDSNSFEFDQLWSLDANGIMRLEYDYKYNIIVEGDYMKMAQTEDPSKQLHWYVDKNGKVLYYTIGTGSTKYHVQVVKVNNNDRLRLVISSDNTYFQIENALRYTPSSGLYKDTNSIIYASYDIATIDSNKFNLNDTNYTINGSYVIIATISSNRFSINGIEYAIESNYVIVTNIVNNIFTIGGMTYTRDGVRIKNGDADIATITSNQFSLKGTTYIIDGLNIKVQINSNQFSINGTTYIKDGSYIKVAIANNKFKIDGEQYEKHDAYVAKLNEMFMKGDRSVRQLVSGTNLGSNDYLHAIYFDMVPYTMWKPLYNSILHQDLTQVSLSELFNVAQSLYTEAPTNHYISYEFNPVPLSRNSIAVEHKTILLNYSDGNYQRAYFAQHPEDILTEYAYTYMSYKGYEYVISHKYENFDMHQLGEVKTNKVFNLSESSLSTTQTVNDIVDEKFNVVTSVIDTRSEYINTQNLIQNSIDIALSTIQQTVTNNSSAIEQLRTSVEPVADQITELNGKVLTNTNNIETINTNITQINTSIEELKNNLNSESSEADNVSSNSKIVPRPFIDSRRYNHYFAYECVSWNGKKWKIDLSVLPESFKVNNSNPERINKTFYDNVITSDLITSLTNVESVMTKNHNKVTNCIIDIDNEYFGDGRDHYFYGYSSSSISSQVNRGDNITVAKTTTEYSHARYGIGGAEVNYDGSSYVLCGNILYGDYDVATYNNVTYYQANNNKTLETTPINLSEATGTKLLYTNGNQIIIDPDRTYGTLSTMSDAYHVISIETTKSIHYNDNYYIIVSDTLQSTSNTDGVDVQTNDLFNYGGSAWWIDDQNDLHKYLNNDEIIYNGIKWWKIGNISQSGTYQYSPSVGNPEEPNIDESTIIITKGIKYKYDGYRILFDSFTNSPETYTSNKVLTDGKRYFVYNTDSMIWTYYHSFVFNVEDVNDDWSVTMLAVLPVPYSKWKTDVIEVTAVNKVTTYSVNPFYNQVFGPMVILTDNEQNLFRVKDYRGFTKYYEVHGVCDMNERLIRLYEPRNNSENSVSGKYLGSNELIYKLTPYVGKIVFKDSKLTSATDEIDRKVLYCISNSGEVSVYTEDGDQGFKYLGFFYDPYAYGTRFSFVKNNSKLSSILNDRYVQIKVNYLMQCENNGYVINLRNKLLTDVETSSYLLLCEDEHGEFVYPIDNYIVTSESPNVRITGDTIVDEYDRDYIVVSDTDTSSNHIRGDDTDSLTFYPNVIEVNNRFKPDGTTIGSYDNKRYQVEVIDSKTAYVKNDFGWKVAQLSLIDDMLRCKNIVYDGMNLTSINYPIVTDAFKYNDKVFSYKTGIFVSQEGVEGEDYDIVSRSNIVYGENIYVYDDVDERFTSIGKFGTAVDLSSVTHNVVSYSNSLYQYNIFKDTWNKIQTSGTFTFNGSSHDHGEGEEISIRIGVNDAGCVFEWKTPTEEPALFVEVESENFSFQGHNNGAGTEIVMMPNVKCNDKYYSLQLTGYSTPNYDQVGMVFEYKGRTYCFNCSEFVYFEDMISFQFNGINIYAASDYICYYGQSIVYKNRYITSVRMKNSNYFDGSDSISSMNEYVTYSESLGQPVANYVVECDYINSSPGVGTIMSISYTCSASFEYYGQFELNSTLLEFEKPNVKIPIPNDYVLYKARVKDFITGDVHFSYDLFLKYNLTQKYKVNRNVISILDRTSETITPKPEPTIYGYGYQSRILYDGVSI